jgi:hypothetical protein
MIGNHPGTYSPSVGKPALDCRNTPQRFVALSAIGLATGQLRGIAPPSCGRAPPIDFIGPFPLSYDSEKLNNYSFRLFPLPTSSIRLSSKYEDSGFS